MHHSPPRGLNGAAGVLLNALFPIWIITFLLVAMLVFLTWKTGKKGLQLFRREQRAARRRAERAAATGGVLWVVLALLSCWRVTYDCRPQWLHPTSRLCQSLGTCSPAVSSNVSRLCWEPSMPVQAAASHMMSC